MKRVILLLLKMPVPAAVAAAAAAVEQLDLENHGVYAEMLMLNPGSKD